MGLFDKLFGGSQGAQDALNQAKHLAQNVLSEAQKKAEQAMQNRPADAPQAPSKPAAPSAASEFSWGPDMPDEENQYSFSGSYDQYFQSVFRSAFPGYALYAEPNGPYHTGMKYTFVEGGRVALVVEVMSDRSSAQRLRRQCEAAGLPYVRFYHDHPGWWNTRAYVISRVKAALPTA